MRFTTQRGLWMVLAAGGWTCFLLLYLVYPTQIPYYLDRFGDREDPSTSYLNLKEHEPPLNSVMLLEGYNNTRLTLRMYCALESAARAHYPTPVVLFMTAKRCSTPGYIRVVKILLVLNTGFAIASSASPSTRLTCDRSTGISMLGSNPGRKRNWPLYRHPTECMFLRPLEEETNIDFGDACN
ncbi:uncharacterized protein LOC125045373 [Penaeus chinensis]|uniref:uncharacterized protein LOC125045373 n=1 Tax=Penaeus chinensis TaxID=139456 RepID=UPI001FB67852|nr:uncharacterized protein LOC125045373 [Penaeus chinensis]